MLNLRVSLQGGKGLVSGAPVVLEITTSNFDFVDKISLKVNQSKSFELEPNTYFVKVFLPSGKVFSSKAVVDANKESKVSFELESPPQTWLRWQHFLGNLPHNSDFCLTDLGEIWQYMWSYHNGNWELQNSPEPFNLYDESTINFELEQKTNSLRLLQIGGTKIIPRFIMIPPSSKSEGLVYLFKEYENSSQDSNNFEDRAVVSLISQDNRAETLLRYLQSGSINSAKLIGTSIINELSKQNLRENSSNPVIFIACAYYCIRVGDYSQMQNWVDQLVNLFNWLPDSHVVYAWYLMRTKSDQSTLNKAAEHLLQATNCGIPIYAEGIRLLYSGLEIVNNDKRFNQNSNSKFTQALSFSRRYYEVINQSQELTTFYGRSPLEPSIAPVFFSKPVFPNSWRNTSKPRLTKQETIRTFQLHHDDVGSSAVQVALLTNRIHKLENHLKANPKDYSSERGLVKLIGKRKNFLNYIKKQDYGHFKILVSQLGIRVAKKL